MDCPAKQEKLIAIENSLRLHTGGRGVIFILLKLFFFKIHDLVHSQFCLSFHVGFAQEAQKGL